MIKKGSTILAQLHTNGEWFEATVATFTPPWIQIRQGDALYGLQIADLKYELIKE